MVAILTMSAKWTTLGLLKIKLFWNRCYDVIISVHDVTNKILSGVSNYIVDVIIRPKFGNWNISMREVAIASVFWPEKLFFEVCSRFNKFKFYNLGLALSITSTFYRSMAKRLQLKVRKFWGGNSYVWRIYKGKTGRPPPSWIGLKR